MTATSQPNATLENETGTYPERRVMSNKHLFLHGIGASKMKIAAITDDSKTVSAHFGQVQFYDVFTITDNQIAAKETRSKANHNHFPRENHEHPHGQAHGTDPASQYRHSALVEPIQVCQVVIAREMGMGVHQSLITNGIHPIITNMDAIEEVLNSYLAGTLTDHPEKLH